MAEVGVITLAERPTRVLLAAAGLLFATLGGLFNSDVSAGAATLVTGVWVVVGLLGLVQLLQAVVRLLRPAARPAAGPASVQPAPPSATTPAGPASAAEAPTEDLIPDEAVTLPLLLDPHD
jgi:CDP-diacylglycerol--glycerol-3-phosphate 3-phosphatidyltransferase